MFRTAALKIGTGVVAGAAASQLNRTTQADARPHRHLPRTQATKNDTAERPPQTEEDTWLEVSLDKDGVIFTNAEIDDTVEEIIGLCSEYAPLQHSAVSGVHSDEGSGDAAGEWIDQETSRSSRPPSQFEQLLRASQRMASHPDVQTAARKAIQEDETLRNMISGLARMRIEEPVEEVAQLEFDEEAARRHGGNAYVTLIRDLGNGLRSVLKAMGGAVSGVGKAVSNAVMWAWNGITRSAKTVGDTMALGPLMLKAGTAFSSNEGAANLVGVMAVVILVAVVFKRALM